jgi:hypothetical protein
MLKVHLDRYPEIVFLMDIVVIDVPDVWGMLLSRKFVAMLGGTLQMDLTYATIPMDDETNATYPTYQWKRIMLKKLTLTLKLEDPLEELPEKSRNPLPNFSQMTFPFTQEEDFDDIEWPKREDYQQQLDRYKDKEIGSVKILKKG